MYTSTISNDVLQTLQASLSTTSPSLHSRAQVDEAVHGEEAGKVLGRLMDWVEARQEAIKLETEEEKEKEDAESSGTAAVGGAGSKLRRPGGPARVDSMQPERPARSILHVNQTPTPARTISKTEDVEDNMVDDGGDAEAVNVTKKPSGAIRQRDALVQAVANARAKDRAGIKEDASEAQDRFAPLALTRPSSPVPINSHAMRESTNPNPSSPLTPTPQAQGYAGHHRPFKGFGQHYRGGSDHRSKLINLNLQRKESHGFKPDFGGAEVPLFPGTEAIADVGSGEMGHGAYGFLSAGNNGTGAVGAATGGKRAHENAFGGSAPVAVPINGVSNSVFGSVPNNAHAGPGHTHTGTGGRGGRRRGGNHGFAGFAMRGNGRVEGSEGEDDVIEGRERKRIARR